MSTDEAIEFRMIRTARLVDSKFKTPSIRGIMTDIRIKGASVMIIYRDFEIFCSE